MAGDASQSTGGNYTRTFRGIAPNANLINLRVLDGTGAGTDSAVIAAIQKAISLKNTWNIRVINLSLGRAVFESYTLDPLCKAVEYAWQNGIVVVAAAGNGGRDNTHTTNGYATITAPGNDPLVITVGAMKDERTLTRSDDMVASYSSKGPTLIDHVVKPDLVAPGNGSFHCSRQTPQTPQHIPRIPCRSVLLRERLIRRVIRALLYFERHEYGDTDGRRDRGIDDSERSDTYAGHGESAADEDGDQEFSGV